MRWTEAHEIAVRLEGALASACARIEIAGSIRRQKPEVKDIELVVIPRWVERPRTDVQTSLFDAAGSEPTQPVNLLAVAVEQFQESGALQVIKPGTPDVVPWHLEPEGKYWRLYLPQRDLKVDVFLCTERTWGNVLTYRTGPAEFSAALLARWKQVTGGGMSIQNRLWRPGIGYVDTPEEADVFAACRVAYVPPELRTGPDVVHRYALADNLHDAVENAVRARLEEAARG